MKLKITKFLLLGIVLSFVFNLFYSYVNYLLLLDNNYFNPYLSASLLIVLFLIIFINVMGKYYKKLFDVEIIAKKMFFLMSIFPLLFFSIYLSFLANIYYDLSFTNYKVNKSAFYTVRTISQDVSDDNLNKRTNDFFKDILSKEKVDADNFSASIQLPNNSIDYGANFVLNIEDTRNYDIIKYYTFVPFTSNFRWIYFYNFINGATNEHTNGLTVTNDIKYTTPYGDYN